MIYDRETFEKIVWETQEGRTTWSYTDFLRRMYGDNYLNVMPAHYFYKEKKFATSEYESTYDTC